jgi:hypothetical protein
VKGAKSLCLMFSVFMAWWIYRHRPQPESLVERLRAGGAL